MRKVKFPSKVPTCKKLTCLAPMTYQQNDIKLFLGQSFVSQAHHKILTGCLLTPNNQRHILLIIHNGFPEQETAHVWSHCPLSSPPRTEAIKPRPTWGCNHEKGDLTSLIVQWLRLHAPSAGGAWVQSLVGELDPT